MNAGLDAADAYCAVLTRRHYENFSVASRFVDAEKRRDLMRIYAYCRTTDDLGDESGGAPNALERLERWRSEVAALFDGGLPIHPVLVALQPTLERCHMSARPFLDLIAANVQDQRVARYRDWEELIGYCRLSAAPVGRMVLAVFGVTGDRADRLSDDVCIGLQLANHAQDVSRDAEIGRRYLVDTDVDARGIEGAAQVMVERARTLLASGEELERLVPRALRLQLALYRMGGLAICDAIQAIGYKTERSRPSVSASTKVSLVVRAALQSFLRGRTA
ncbi:MAG: squalene/phytoene synthase family protein [Candidatus Eremiobacteraeota bacterium]|nr:squalene/phytoene synthase family protein [Candidatus Eremiobacteraeota bacterium]